MTSDPKNNIMRRAADTGKSVHLSASAGSGKTRALKDRYLALIDHLDRRGLNIDQVVAITFTDKAAAEIKERVMHDLPETMLKKIIRGTQNLRISTIHSFCMNLLKRYPLEAGLPPDFGVLDSRDQAYKIQKAVEDALNEADLHSEIMAPLNSFTVDGLISIIESLISIRSRLKRMEIDSDGPAGFIQSIRHGMEIESTAVEIQRLLSSKEWRSSFEHMEKLLKLGGTAYADCLGNEHLLLSRMQNPAAAYKVAGTLFPLYYTLESTPRKHPKINMRSFKTKDIWQEYKTLFIKLQELLYHIRETYERIRSGTEAIRLITLYLRAEELYRESKLREGLLDFDDLEIFAYRLLQGLESPDILYWLDRKILHFLVDEFQDTSDIQWAILQKLTGEIFSGEGADKPMPPTLFVVGDEKQSIYRFREANYRLIHTVREKMETYILPASREILTLDKNFRSTPEVIETVNRIFSGLWGDHYMPAEVARRQHQGSVRLIELLSETEAVDGQPTEAEILAAEIKSMVQNGLMVYERASDSDTLLRTEKPDKMPIQPDLFSPSGADWRTRPADYGDCAILIQSRTKLKEYEAALQAQGIPYRVVGGVGFYEEEEIQALINVLFFLWNQDDSLALAAALKSPLFGLTDSDILALRLNSADFAYSLNHMRPWIGTMLETWTGLAKLIPLSALVHQIIAETGAYVLFGKRNPQAVFNIDKLLDTAREFDRRGYTTLQDFVEWVKHFRQTEQREATSDMNLPGFRGSVSILTVHKAKGLEYPIVLLPGMNQPARSLTLGPEVLIDEVNGKRRIAIGRVENPVYEELWKGEHGEREELCREHQRLLYVAMTRARDHLIMLGTLTHGRNPVNRNTWLDFLQQSLRISREHNGDAGTLVTQYSYPDWGARPLERVLTHQRMPGQQNEPGVNMDIMVRNIAPLPVSETPAWKSVTDFIEKKHGSEFEFLSPPVEAGEVPPITRGSVLHRCLEEVTTKGTCDLDLILEEFPDILLLSSTVRQSFSKNVSAVLNAVVEAKDLNWIFARRESSFSELPFLYARGRSFISGIIDRVVIKEDAGFVIDYKAILIHNNETLDSWVELYRPQIQIYAEAVKHLFGLKSVEGYLLFLDSTRLQLVVKV